MQSSSIKKNNINLKELRSKLKYTSDEFQAGMNILIYGRPNMTEVKEVLERLRNLGINSVALNFPFYQSDWQANEVSISHEHTPTIAELRDVIEMAHNSDLSVMIKPIMDEKVFLAANKWRGQIEPTDPHRWFESYQTLILTYAELAHSTNVKSLNIGTELNSMQNKYQHRWIELIESIRRVYQGNLLYSFNYDTVSEIPSLEFIQLLDQIGIDAYFPLKSPNHADVTELKKAWEKQLDQLEDSLWQNSIIVTEVGILPIAGAYRTPYAWRFSNGIFDPQAQVNYFEATYHSWKPKVDGIYWWAVILGEDPNAISYSPLGLPTEDAMKQHLLKDYENE